MEEIKPFECPECHGTFKDPEPLGPHIERHAPVGRPRWATKKRCPYCEGDRCENCLWFGREMLTEKCPKGCGRHFPKSNGSVDLGFTYHMRLCDGRKPLRTKPRNGTPNGKPKSSGGHPSLGSVSVLPSVEEMVDRNGKL